MTKFMLPVVIAIVFLILPFKTQAAASADESFKAASVVFNPQILHFQSNLETLVETVRASAAQGAKLIVLPELTTTGYLYNNRDQINHFLDDIPGATTSVLEPIANQYNAYIIVGIAEQDPITHVAYNSAALIGPNGYIGKYRKNQLNSKDANWAARGNLGFPVFDTALGKIAMLIGEDDAYIQSLEIPALRGANIIAHLNASAYPSNVANIASLAGWIGTYIITSNRTNSETNPATGETIQFVGGASIWDPNGKQLAQAGVTSADKKASSSAIYATINPAAYDNAAKNILLKDRRPALYQDLSLSGFPMGAYTTSKAHDVNALLLQYTPQTGDKEANLKKVYQLLQQKPNQQFNLIVLPQNSLIGTLSGKEMQEQSEPLNGNSVNKMMVLAKLYHSYLIFSLPEKNQQQYFATAVLISDQGKIAGIYRKTHLNKDEKTWATPGNDIPVFTTDIGRIGIILGDEVRVPDLATLMSVKRVDMIVVPSSYSGDYAGPVMVDKNLLVKPFPDNTMAFWYNLAKYAQAYTLVANFVGGENKYSGSSGLYSLNPVQGNYPPVLASDNESLLFIIKFKTLGGPDWRMNQNKLVIGRRAELATPLILSTESDCFKNWKKDSMGIRFCWN